jgi:hypothetical protein
LEPLRKRKKRKRAAHRESVCQKDGRRAAMQTEQGGEGGDG